MYQSWPKGSLNILTALQNISATAATFKDFHVSEAETKIAFVTSDLSNGIVIYTIDHNNQLSSPQYHNQFLPANAVAINGTSMLFLVRDSGNWITKIYKYDLSGSLQDMKTVPYLHHYLTVTPNF